MAISDTSVSILDKLGSLVTVDVNSQSDVKRHANAKSISEITKDKEGYLNDLKKNVSSQFDFSNMSVKSLLCDKTLQPINIRLDSHQAFLKRKLAGTDIGSCNNGVLNQLLSGDPLNLINVSFSLQSLIDGAINDLLGDILSPIMKGVDILEMLGFCTIRQILNDILNALNFGGNFSLSKGISLILKSISCNGKTSSYDSLQDSDVMQEITSIVYTNLLEYLSTIDTTLSDEIIDTLLDNDNNFKTILNGTVKSLTGGAIGNGITNRLDYLDAIVDNASTRNKDVSVAYTKDSTDYIISRVVASGNNNNITTNLSDMLNNISVLNPNWNVDENGNNCTYKIANDSTCNLAGKDVLSTPPTGELNGNITTTLSDSEILTILNDNPITCVHVINRLLAS